MTGTTVRVVIVDDDALVRSGLRLILGGDTSIEIVGEAGDGVAATRVVAQTAPDVVLMDIRMPQRDGLEATRRIVAARGRTGGEEGRPRVIVLTTFDTDAMVLEALRVGASGFLLKDTPPERLVAAVLAVAAGEPILSPSVTAQLMATVSAGDSTRRTEAEQRLAVLTDREREVAIAVGRGLSNAEVAQELFMSVPTVKAHVSRLFAKLDRENRVQIAILVHDAEIL